MNIKNNRRFLDNDFNADKFEKIKSNNRHGSNLENRKPGHENINADFRCAHCKAAVSAARADCGVNNRNHCPYCLWSLHVDLHKAGDRLSGCHARMQPIGLTMKQTFKRYNSDRSGELMLIHRCTSCGKLSINRIAADDNPQMIFDLFRASFQMEGSMKQRLINNDIRLLGAGDQAAVYAQLFGWQGIVDGLVENACCEQQIVIDETIQSE